jgi:hypothetical protein
MSNRMMRMMCQLSLRAVRRQLPARPQSEETDTKAFPLLPKRKTSLAGSNPRRCTSSATASPKGFSSWDLAVCGAELEAEASIRASRQRHRFTVSCPRRGSERVTFRVNGYAVVERLIAEEYMEETDPARMTWTDQDAEETEEALRTLYRLRADFAERQDLPPSVLKAIESLLEGYEGKRT